MNNAMKNKKVKASVSMLFVLLFSSAFVCCSISEREDIEIRRCPQVQDSIIMPGWDEIE